MNPEKVFDFLQANPDFLLEHPELLPSQQGNVVNFQSMMMQKLRRDKDRADSRQRMMLDNARANMTIQARIQAAVLRVVEARNFDELIEIIGSEVSLMLQVDVITLVFEQSPITIQFPNTVSVLPQGSIYTVMGEQMTLVQANVNGDKRLYGPAARLVKSQALLRLDLGPNGPDALIAFGSRDPLLFSDAMGTELVGFFVSVVDRILRNMMYASN